MLRPPPSPSVPVRAFLICRAVSGILGNSSLYCEPTYQPTIWPTTRGLDCIGSGWAEMCVFTIQSSGCRLRAVQACSGSGLDDHVLRASRPHQFLEDTHLFPVSCS